MPLSDILSALLPDGSQTNVIRLLALGCGIASLGCCALAILLYRAHATLRAVLAAHSASGQGSILVNRNASVVKMNGPARKLLWPKLPANEIPVLMKPVQALLEDAGEQHHLMRFASNRSVELSISSVSAGSRRFGGVRGLVVRDVTEQRKGQQRLVRLAHYDSLTGLGNRRLFVERLGAAISAARERHEQVALLYIDLDRFKEVNDTLGHGAGDKLLRTMSRRLAESIHSTSKIDPDHGRTISRLAGDEFAMIVPHVRSMYEIEELAQQALSIITEPIEILERHISSSGSIGIALFPDHADDVEDLVKHADAALYAAKAKGRARHVVYEASFSKEADRAHRIEQGLRQAIELNEFSVHYQPKVNLENDTVSGFEALLRWYNCDLDFVGPNEFIPIAEERGMINEIGAWCLDETCRQIRAWQDAGFTTVPVSVNVSSAQFRDTDVQRLVSDALVKHNIHPSLLEIELTESLLLDDGNATAIALRDLRAIGVGIALDDFGTGYSALTYLNRFPLDVVKMDRGFIRDIEDSDSAAGIASAVISMSHSLGFKVVAEGVDSPLQADLLRAMGCDQIQGFLFSPAIPGEEATRFLASENSKAPTVKPRLDPIAPTATIGDSNPPEDEESLLPVIHASPSIKSPDSSEPPRLLIIDTIPSTLGTTSYRLTQLEADVHLVTDTDEAKLFVEQESPTIDLVIADPSVNLAALAELIERLKKWAPNHVPRLLICGAEPDNERKQAIRSAHADWVLWDPFADPELKFFLNAARSNRSWKFQRQSVRVPFDAMAWIRAGGKRGTGVITNLSRRGAFIETSESYSVGQPIRIEFKIDSKTVTLFANVTGVQTPSPRNEDESPLGINVIFYEVDDSTDSLLGDVVERLWLRFLA
jgi:diguanylate cyclase (GGDEF)-like protein